MEFIASQITSQHIASMLEKPPHAIGIFASAGNGKAYMARYLAQQLLATDTPTAAQIYIVRPNDKGVITIEQARDLLSFTKLKSHHKNKISRVIIIEDAHVMTTEAQNALLKVIEEPPTDTVIIITASNPSSILTTIVSRLTSLNISPVAKARVSELYPETAEAEFNKAWVISNGRIGLMHAMITDSDNELLQDINTAKEILQANTQQRLARVDSLQKSNIPALLEALLIVAKAGRTQATSKNAHTQIKKWQAVIKQVLTSQKALQHNPNQKLLLTNLMLEL